MTTGRINQVATSRRPRGLAIAPEPKPGNVVSYNPIYRQADHHSGESAIFYTRPGIPLQERTPQDDQASKSTRRDAYKSLPAQPTRTPLTGCAETSQPGGDSIAFTKRSGPPGEFRDRDRSPGTLSTRREPSLA